MLPCRFIIDLTIDDIKPYLSDIDIVETSDSEYGEHGGESEYDEHGGESEIEQHSGHGESDIIGEPSGESEIEQHSGHGESDIIGEPSESEYGEHGGDDSSFLTEPGWSKYELPSASLDMGGIDSYWGT
jgi:hypothetical protein